MSQNFSNVTSSNFAWSLTFEIESLEKSGSIIGWDTVVIYLIFFPIIVTFGVIGNGVSIIAMWKQSRNGNVYFLQLFIQCWMAYPFCIIMPFLTKSYIGANWVKSSEVLSMYGIYVVNPMLHTFITGSLLLIAFTNLDRLQVIGQSATPLWTLYIN